MTDKTHFIDGRWQAGRNDGFASFDPATEEVVWRGAEASTEQVGEAVGDHGRAGLDGGQGGHLDPRL